MFRSKKQAVCVQKASLFFVGSPSPAGRIVFCFVCFWVFFFFLFTLAVDFYLADLIWTNNSLLFLQPTGS